MSPVQKRLNTSFMLPPFCMEITRRWSSSFTHTRNVLLSLCLETNGGVQPRSKPTETLTTKSPGTDEDSPDAPGVGPVPAHPGGQQQRRHGLVEQEVVVDELLLLGVGHVLQGVVLPVQVSAQGGQSCTDQGDVYNSEPCFYFGERVYWQKLNYKLS